MFFIRTSQPFRTLFRISIPLLFTLLLADIGADAQTPKRWLQPGSIPAMKPRFRTSDTTFLIGCYAQPEKLPSVDSVWRFLEAYGIDGTLVGWNSTDVDTYLNSTDRGDKWVIANTNPVVKAAWGREIEFFLHADTAWSEYWVCKFYQKSGGATQTNSIEEDWYKRDANERVYESLNTTLGDTIAKWITFDWLPGQTHRYKDPGGYHDTTVQTSYQWITRRRNANADDLPLASLDNDITHVVVKGHIFDDPSTNSDPDGTVYLRIDVVHERPEGSTYKNSSGAPMLVTADYEEAIIGTLEVTKGDLKPLTIDEPFDRYREVLFSVDMTECADGSTGPGSGESSSQRFDLRVQWTGEGKVALRSIAIRDDLGQYLLGRRPEDVEYRADIFNAAKRTVYGPDWETTPVLRDGLLRYTLGDEPLPTEWTGFEFLNLMLRDTFNLSAAVGDSLSGYTAQTGNHWDAPHFHDATTWEEVAVQHWYPTGALGWNFEPYAPGSPFRKHILDSTLLNYFGLPFTDVPSIQEHNGGRFNIPEMPLNATGVAGYTETFQRLHFNAYLPGLPEFERSHPEKDIWRYQALALNKLGLAAETSRNTGRAMLLVPGITGSVEMDWKIKEINNGGADTVVERVFVHSHISEPAELRMSLNLGLCYGAVGSIYYWLTNYMHVMGVQPKFVVEGNECWAGLQDSFGPISEDSRYDFNVDTLRFRKSPWTSGGALVKEFVPDFFVGYKNRSQEIIWLNKEWLPRIGAEMMRRGLRWRDAYSIHGSQPRPSTRDTQLFVRPLPSNEIVTGVKAWHPITGRIDSIWGTYVELGLFYTKSGSGGNAVLDTNYVYVVNRRTFERPPDISDTSARGRLMDTLAETRTIELTVNLVNPDPSNQYNKFVRIREVLPDRSPLPLIGARHVLDTVVRYGSDGKSKVRLTLGSGRAALLECTYAQPDESIHNGILQRNGQRKLLYSNGKYHSTYFRKVYNYDSTQWDYEIFYRQSFPVALTGTIQWEPVEWKISGLQIAGVDIPRSDNRYPSLTSRTIGPDTVISIVWDAHPTGGSGTDREILLRDVRHTFTINLLTGDTVPAVQFSPIRSVAFHDGMNADEYGTPVISSASFGDFVAWSDSIQGICARARRLDPPSFLWPATPVWTQVDTVTQYLVGMVGMSPGKFPTMPPFTNRVLTDSSAGLAWQQQYAPGLPYIGIFYVRLFYTPMMGGPKVTERYLNDSFGYLMVSPNEGVGWTNEQHLHPSIDVTQDALGRRQEGITWERHYPQLHPGGSSYEYITEVYFRQIGFDTITGFPKRIGNPISKIDSWPNIDEGYGYPVISSQNQVMTLADSATLPLFSIVYREPSNIYDMAVIEGRYRTNQQPQWTTSQPRNYIYGGNHPNGAASEKQLMQRYAALYQTQEDGGGDSILRTTREYYSRVRPGGYGAEGTRIEVVYNDSLALGLTASLEDLWMATSEDGRSIRMNEYTAPQQVSSLLELLRSQPFTAWDSVRIGCRVDIALAMPDSILSTGKNLVCFVEVVDSVTGETTAILDSIRLSAESCQCMLLIDQTLDLLSGTYYVRLRLESPELENEMDLIDSASRWSVTHIYRFVDGVAGKTVGRLAGESEDLLRISAQPNPFGEETEIRFSVPRRDYVTVTLYDGFGRRIAQLVERQLFESGRYAVPLDAGNLLPGTYLVELRTLNGRAVEKLSLTR